jgi:hypothetical protein
MFENVYQSTILKLQVDDVTSNLAHDINNKKLTSLDWLSKVIWHRLHLKMKSSFSWKEVVVVVTRILLSTDDDAANSDTGPAVELPVSASTASS